MLKYTYIGSKAMSCGAVLFTAGDHRIMAPGSKLMIHQVSGGSWGKVEDQEMSTREGKALNKQIFKIMAKNCGHEADYFLKLLAGNKYADIFLTPNQAAVHNLCTEIGTPRLDVKVKQTVSVSVTEP